MLNLNAAPAGPDWTDIAGGAAKVLLHPADSETLSFARAWASRQQRRPEDADDSWRPRAYGHLLTIGCAIWGIREWEGIGVNDEPVPVSEQAVDWLLTQQPAVYAQFDDKYVEPLMALLVGEKNGSAASANGTSEAAPKTARAAKTSSERNA